MAGLMIPECFYFAGVCMVIYFTALLLESSAAYLSGRSIYDWRESIANTLILIVFALMVVSWSNYVILGLYLKIYALSSFQIFERTQNEFLRSPLTQAFLLFLLDDLCFYFYHRVMHKNRYCWAMHETHHSSKWFNITAAGREPTTAIFITSIFWIPFVVVGFRPELVLFQQWLNLTYQLLVHTSMVGKLGPLDWIFNTPSHHRVHHGLNDHYRDKNFGGILIIWDRLFGTFEPEGVKPIYGIEPQLQSYSPWRITFNGFTTLFAERRREKEKRRSNERSSTRRTSKI